MTTALTTQNQTTAGVIIKAEHSFAAMDFIDQSLSPATRRAYRSDWQIFTSWCAQHDYPSLPTSSAVLTVFLSEQAQTGASPATISRRIAAIRCAHEARDLPTPTTAKEVTAVLKGIRRKKSVRPRQKTPLTAARIHTLLEHCDTRSLIGLRDRALLLLGFAGAFRRSELVALTVEDLQAVPEGYRVTIRHSKTDQEGRGHVVPIFNGGQLAVADAVRQWLDAAGIDSGPVFRAVYKGGRIGHEAIVDKVVVQVVKKYAERAGLQVADFAGHSLRAGFLTSAAEAGASIFKMMDVSRHKRVDTVRGYVRSAELFKDHAGAAFL